MLNYPCYVYLRFRRSGT